MKTIIFILVAIVVIAHFTNPSLDDWKEYVKTQTAASIVDAGLESISNDHLGISVCRSDFYFGSFFYMGAKINAFGIDLATKTCRPSAIGFFGMIFPLSEKESKELEQELKKSGGSGDDCPDECDVL